MDLAQDRLGDCPRPLCAVGENSIDVTRIRHQLAHFIGYRRKLLDGQLGKGRLEITESTPTEFLQNICRRLIGQCRKYPDQVGCFRPFLQAFRFRGKFFRVGFCPSDFFRNFIRRIRKRDPRLIGRVRFRHFLRPVPQAHDPGCFTENKRLDNREELHAEIIIEFLGNVARQFEVLLLVFADRHMGRPVGHDVRRHQVRIGIQPNRGIFAVLAGLFLELGHPVQPTEPGDTIEYPRELGVG